jgi:SAM-dependent methyltransferase
MSRQTQESEYVFDNAGEQTPDRFAGLEYYFDAGTFRHVDALGVAPGWRCLEIGGGSGSVARWLSERVGAQGQVVVTDINTRFLTHLSAPNLEVREHDVVNGDLEQDHYDLAHTRLVLVHLPERERAIDRIISALRPGGLILFEEFDVLSMTPDPQISPSETMLKTITVLWRVMRESGVDQRHGRLLAGILDGKGMQDVAAEGRVFRIKGGSPWAHVLRANCEQMHDKIIASGDLTEDEFQADIQSLDDPKFVMLTAVMWAVSARRP